MNKNERFEEGRSMGLKYLLTMTDKHSGAVSFDYAENMREVEEVKALYVATKEVRHERIPTVI